MEKARDKKNLTLGRNEPETDILSRSHLSRPAAEPWSPDMELS